MRTAEITQATRRRVGVTMKLIYEIQANHAGDARTQGENRARAEGWTTLTGTFVTWEGGNTYRVEILATNLRRQ